LLSARRGLEPWQATLVQEGKRIQPPRAVGPRREGPSAFAEASVSVSAGGPIVVRPFPPGDPKARRVRSLKLTQEPDGSLAVEPCRVLAANQILYPFRTPHGTFIEHMHCAVVKVSAPGYADVALWFTNRGPSSGWRSDMELYRAYSMQAMRDGIDIEGGVDAMPHEAGWCEVTSEKVLLFHLVKLKDGH